MKRRLWFGLLVVSLSSIMVSAIFATVRAQSTGPNKPLPTQSIELLQPAQQTGGGGGPIGTTFTYQGLLKKNGAPFNGSCDMQFKLWDTFGKDNLISTVTSTPSPVPVANGLFTVWLDFGDQFQGDYRYIEPLVSCPTSGSPVYQSLGVQATYPTPYALSLREGATISGTVYTGLKIIDTYPSGNALEAYADNGSDGWGIYGQGSGAGLVGRTSTIDGAGVFARGSDNASFLNTALWIHGGKLKISGSSISPAFVYTVVVVSSGCSSISNPLIDGDPNAIILVTPRQDTITAPSTDVKVLYSIATWYLCSPSLSSGMKYNMLVINQ